VERGEVLESHAVQLRYSGDIFLKQHLESTAKLHTPHVSGEVTQRTSAH
jgi:hypothetical protein